jgi:hypothetical protein
MILNYIQEDLIIMQVESLLRRTPYLINPLVHQETEVTPMIYQFLINISF